VSINKNKFLSYGVINHHQLICYKVVKTVKLGKKLQQQGPQIRLYDLQLKYRKMPMRQ